MKEIFLVFLWLLIASSWCYKALKYEAKHDDLYKKVITPKQFTLDNKTYRCFHFPEIKDEE